MKFNFESSTWTVEVIRTRSPCPCLLDFLRNLFYFKKKLKYGQRQKSIFHVSNLDVRSTHPLASIWRKLWEDSICEWPLRIQGKSTLKLNSKNTNMGLLVHQINSFSEALKLEKICQKNKAVTGKTPLFVIGPFYSFHSICLNIGFWQSSLDWKWCVFNLSGFN